MMGKTYLSLIQYRRPESGSNLLDADIAKWIETRLRVVNLRREFGDNSTKRFVWFSFYLFHFE